MGRWLLARVPCDCPLCGARVGGARLCEGCELDLAAASQTPPDPRCPRCALRLGPDALHCAACLARPPAFVRTIAAFDYEPPADTLIRQLKTQLRLSAAPVLARLLAHAVWSDPPPAALLLVPVPSSRASLRRRGLNPANGMAAELRKLANVLGLLQQEPEQFLQGGAQVDDGEVAEIEALIKQRNEARAAKDWALADAARDRLNEMNIVLEDGPQGTTWRRK